MVQNISHAVMAQRKKTIDDINFKFPNLGKFNHSLNKNIYSIY